MCIILRLHAMYKLECELVHKWKGYTIGMEVVKLELRCTGCVVGSTHPDPGAPVTLGTVNWTVTCRKNQR